MASPLNPNQFDPLGLRSPSVGAKPIQRGPVRYEDTVRSGGAENNPPVEDRFS